MRATLRSRLTALVAAGLTFVPAIALGQGQTAPAQGKAKAAPAAPKPSPADLAKRNEVIATVNADKITRADLVQLLSQYNIAPGTEKANYTTGLDLLINTHLLTQFLDENRVVVDPAEIDKIIDEQRRAASEGGSSLENALAEAGMTIAQVKKQIGNTLQWAKYVDKMSTDAALTDFMKANPDVFANTLVKASHIQINADENAPAAERQKAKETLAALKKDIVAGKITFADAANKVSEDPANKEQPSGGDLKWFPRKKFTEPFSAAAFSLKKGEISDPVETEYGVHLIQVTDRKEGKMPVLEMVKEKAKNQYALDEQNRLVAEMRKKAKIDVKPMPADFFVARPAAAPEATKDAAKGAATSK